MQFYGKPECMQRQYLEDEMCLLSPRDFTVADFSGDEQQYKSLRCHVSWFSRGGEFMTLCFPQSMISHFATPLSSDSSLSCTIVLQTSHQLLNDPTDSLKLFKSTLNFLKICSEIHPSYFPLPCSISKGRFLFWFVVLFSWLPPTRVEAFEDSFRVEYVVLVLLKKYSSWGL